MHDPHSHDHPPRRTPLPSLMLMSAGRRLSGVAVLLAALWAAVAWVLGAGS